MSQKSDSKDETPQNEEIALNIDNQENDLIPFLSKDLFEKINSAEEDEKSEKNNNIITDKFTSTLLKDSEDHFHDNEEYDDEKLIIEEKELDSFDLNKNNLHKDYKETLDKKTSIQEKDFIPRVSSEPLIKPEINKNSLIFTKGNSDFNLGTLIGDDEKKFINVNSSNNLQSNINFINSSFSKNGKSGWICSYCKNFNYESK